MAYENFRQLANVLLIEDNVDDEGLALRAFRTCGRALAVHVARDGPRARRLLGLDGGPSPSAAFDLVVSDYKLPGLDGHALLCLARNDRTLGRLPYILFSSSREASDVRRCLDCGADAFVQKPVGYEEYLTCLRQVVPWALDGLDPMTTPACVIASDLTLDRRRIA